jgi:integrative and conjugative element protein (TIGR02256 family)
LNDPVLLIAESAIALLQEIAARSHPLETGGVMVGVYADGNPWVTGVVEIASKDRGRHHYRIPGGTTQPAVLKARNSDCRVGYLGDWHSHPSDAPPSSLDLASLRFVSYVQPRRPNPTMLVLRHKDNSTYTIDARRIAALQVRKCHVRVTGELVIEEQK